MNEIHEDTTLPQLSEDVNTGHDRTLSGRTVDFYVESIERGYNNKLVVHKPLIRKMMYI